MRTVPSPFRPNVRAGFTLIEMLVVVTLVLIMVSLTVVAVGTMQNSDRIRSSARTIQSALLGARDQAAFAKAPRGLRFLFDPDRPWVCTSMIYVAPQPDYRVGTVQLGRQDQNNDNMADTPQVRTIRGTNTGWYNLYSIGLLSYGARIRIRSDKLWYTVDTSQLTSSSETLLLTVDYADPPTYASPSVAAFDPWTPDPATGLADYILQLNPAVLPGQEPIQLSSGIAIDLWRSQRPTTWYQQQSQGALQPGWSQRTLSGGNVIAYQANGPMDVMFTPQGRVSGALSAAGLIHLYLTDSQDIDNDDFTATYPITVAQGDKLLSSIFTATGNAGTFPVDTTSATDADSDGIPDGFYNFARRGAAANR